MLRQSENTLFGRYAFIIIGFGSILGILSQQS